MTPTVHGICAFAVKVYQPYFVEQVFLISQGTLCCVIRRTFTKSGAVMTVQL